MRVGVFERMIQDKRIQEVCSLKKDHLWQYKLREVSPATLLSCSASLGAVYGFLRMRYCISPPLCTLSTPHP